MDSTVVKVHPDGTGAQKETGMQASASHVRGWTTGIHPVASDARTTVTPPLSPRQAHDAPDGRRPLHRAREGGKVNSPR